MAKATMDLGSVIVEVEEVAPGTLMLTREISRKRGYRVRTKREAYVNWDRTIKAPEVPYRGLGNDPGKILGNVPENELVAL